MIRALKLGDGGLTDEEVHALHDIGDEISGHERRAMARLRKILDEHEPIQVDPGLEKELDRIYAAAEKALLE